MAITVVLAMMYMWWKKTPFFPFGAPEVRWLLVARGMGGFFGVFGIYCMGFLGLDPCSRTVETLLTTPQTPCYTFPWPTPLSSHFWLPVFLAGRAVSSSTNLSPASRKSALWFPLSASSSLHVQPLCSQACRLLLLLPLEPQTLLLRG